jgi:predicted N-formylglutamate amidohydrolase
LSSLLRCTDPAGEKAWADRLARILGEIEATLRAQKILPG